MNKQEQGEPFDVQIYRSGVMVYGFKSHCTAIVGKNNGATLITTNDLKERVMLAARVQLYLNDLIRIIVEDSVTLTKSEVEQIIKLLNSDVAVDSNRIDPAETLKELFERLKGGAQ